MQSWTSPQDSRNLKLPEYLDDRHIKVVMLPALNLVSLEAESTLEP